MSLRVLVSAPYLIPEIDRFIPRLKAAGVELVVAPVEERLNADQLLAYAGEVDGVICGDDHFTEQVLEAFSPRLKVISKWGTGIDSIDRASAQTLGVRVFNTPGAFTDPVADSVLGYILAFARRLPWMDHLIKSGDWQKVRGHSLAESTVGVIGVGRIGKAVLRRLQPFKTQMLGNDPIEPAREFVSQVGVRMTSLEELLESADYVSLNCDLNPTSFHLIGKHELSIMRPGAILVNTARGAVVDQAALVKALQTGQIAGAALDVFEDEPLPDESPLRSMDQVLLAPHNANSSPRAWERVHENTLQNLLTALGISIPELSEDPFDPTA